MTERQRERREAKKRRDDLLGKLLEAERRGESERVTLIRVEVSNADRAARGAL